MSRLMLSVVLLGLSGLNVSAQTLTLVGLSERPMTLDRPAVEAAGLSEIRVSREIAVNGSAERQETVFSGVSLPALLDRNGFETLDRHAVRAASIVVTSHDGYKASFSWGELFNAPAGKQVVLILKENGAPLPARAGAYTVRAFGDLRPGPRHVRDVSEIRVVTP